jgi:hypothetical protein
MALVICCVDITELIRFFTSFKLAIALDYTLTACRFILLVTR